MNICCNDIHNLNSLVITIIVIILCNGYYSSDDCVINTHEFCAIIEISNNVSSLMVLLF